jgi:hypothetical protein
MMMRMADLNFDCPLCGQNLDAPDDMAGLFIECPACAKIIKVPTPNAQQKATMQLRRPPPPPAAPQRTAEEEKAMQEQKGSTIPIKLPPNLGVPQPKQRRIIIKRSEH